jgi:hypothetical protein
VNFAKLPELLRGPPQNVTFTDAMRDGRDDSLRFMRERMFRDQNSRQAFLLVGWKASSMSSTCSPSCSLTRKSAPIDGR